MTIPTSSSSDAVKPLRYGVSGQGQTPSKAPLSGEVT